MKVTLSSNELEILRKSAEGMTAKEIAIQLNVPHQIISNYQKNLLLKTGEGSLINALQSIARRGFVLSEDRAR